MFFDLVYVFAIGELSNHLLAHVDLRAGAERAVLALAVFYAWYMVAWGANWLDPDAFGDRAWLFATGYLVLQIGARRVPDRGPALSTAGRALRQRPPLGVAGRGVLGGRRDGHLVERFRLFFIIVLGETVLTTGDAFAGQPFEVERLLALAIGFTGTVGLWWCYFERAEPLGIERVEAADDAGEIGLWATWTLTLIVLALIAIAVADELAIAHPGDDVTLGFAILAFGGPALVLLAQLLFTRVVFGYASRSRLIGLAALVILVVATAPLTLIVGIAVATAVIVAVATADTAREGDSTPV